MHDGLLEDLLVADVGLDQSPETGNDRVCLFVELEGEKTKKNSTLTLSVSARRFGSLLFLPVSEARAADVSCRNRLRLAINTSNYNFPLTEQVHQNSGAERNPAKLISPVSSHPTN